MIALWNLALGLEAINWGWMNDAAEDHVSSVKTANKIRSTGIQNLSSFMGQSFNYEIQESIIFPLDWILCMINDSLAVT